MDGADHCAAASQAFARAALRVYMAAPKDFVATRKREAAGARAHGDRELANQIAGLRKPTAGADAINRLVHTDHPVLARIVSMGIHLRQAQAALDMSTLTQLRPDREAVLDDALSAIEEVLGQQLSTARAAGVRESFIAAFADEQAQDVALSGMLTRTLSYSGFGEVDLAQATVRTSSGNVLTALIGGQSHEQKAEAGPLGEAAAEQATSAEHRQSQERELKRSREEERSRERAREEAEAHLVQAERELSRSQAEVLQASRLLHAAQQRLNQATAHYEEASKALNETKSE